MIDTCFELTSNLLQVFIYTWFVTGLFGFKEKNIKSILMFVLTVIIGFSILSFINEAVLYDGLLSGFVTLTVTIYSCTILKGSFFKHIFVNIFATAIIFTLASLAIFITSHISGKYAGYMISVLSLWRVAGVCFCRLCEYLIFRAIIKINMEYTLAKKEWILFITLPAATWVALTFMTQAVLVSNEILKYMFYIIFILILIDIVIIYFMFKMKQDADVKLENEMLKMQNESMKHTEKDLRAMSENTYSLQHDLKDRFLTVRTLAEAGKCDEIISYANNVCDNEISDDLKVIFTENDVFNAIINTKLELCKQKNIFCNAAIQSEAADHIETTDLSVIFGNMFNNAIEAAEMTKERLIIFKVQIQGDYVSIYMENSYNPDCSDTNLNTTKKEKAGHGYGTKNMKKTIKEIGGMIDFFVNKQGRFCCDILYPAESLWEQE